MAEIKYVILSLNDSTKDKAIFWRPNNQGYTSNPWLAGLYTEEQVKNDPTYYNNGVDTIAICIDNGSVSLSGLTYKLNTKQLKAFVQTNMHPKK